jgi:hypothetical protein
LRLAQLGPQKGRLVNPLWSYGLAAIGILGIYLAGQKKAVGWAVGFGAQLLWIAYAIATDQPGFIVSAVAYGAVYGRNYLRWRREAAACDFARGGMTG